MIELDFGIDLAAWFSQFTETWDILSPESNNYLFIVIGVFLALAALYWLTRAAKGRDIG